FLVPEVEDVNGLIFVQAEIFPGKIRTDRLALVEVKKSYDVVRASEMIDFQIPDAFISVAGKKIQRTNIDCGIHPLYQLDALGREIGEPIAHQRRLASESLQCGPRTRLFDRQRRPHDEHIRVCVPRDVVREVVLHRRAHGVLEAVPVWQHVRADARTIHQPDAFERHHPATKQVTIWTNARANAPQRLAIKLVSVVSRAPHKTFLVAILAYDDRLTVDLEILVAPTRELREQVL